MAVNTKHPMWDRMLSKWTKVADCYEGEDRVKEMGTLYLPPTAGMKLDGMNTGQDGLTAYNDYKTRAAFPDLVREGVEAMVGVMHRENAKIEVPARMKPMLDRLTINGDSALTLLRKINTYQLIHGRVGLLLEVPTGEGPDALPYVAFYQAPSIINWDDGVRKQGRQELELVVLDESDNRRISELAWVMQEQYRICALSAVAASLGNMQQDGEAAGYYRVAVVGEDQLLSAAEWITPMIAGRTFDRIPFVVVNTNDIATDVAMPPLLGLANRALTIYRGDADYRQSLYMQSQETLVVIGVDEEKQLRVGAGAKLELPRNGDAKYIGTSANGLNAQRTALMDDMAQAQSSTVKMLDSSGSSYQSGEALRVRVAAKTATLQTIARTGAEGLQYLLRLAAEWMGEDPEAVTVKANTEFADTESAGRSMLELTQAKNLGAPLCNESLHQFAFKNGLTEMTFDTEMENLDDDVMLVPKMAGNTGNPAGAQGKGVNDDDETDTDKDGA